MKLKNNIFNNIDSYDFFFILNDFNYDWLIILLDKSVKLKDYHEIIIYTIHSCLPCFIIWRYFLPYILTYNQLTIYIRLNLRNILYFFYIKKIYK